MASLKLALVGLKGFEDYFPSEISGGMQKRAGLARAMALDPDILFLDEPSAGLDPISSRLLDDLIVALRDSLGATIVIVSHELASILSIGDDCDLPGHVRPGRSARRAIRATLLEHCDNETSTGSSPAAGGRREGARHEPEQACQPDTGRGLRPRVRWRSRARARGVRLRQVLPAHRARSSPCSRAR